MGLYWGSSAFNIVENINGQIANIFHIPLDGLEPGDGIDDGRPDNLKIPLLIQKALEFRAIKTKKVNVCIPTNQLLFRSFSIPFIDKKDVASVIEFEVTKYIPIGLKNLTYTYYVIPYIENNQRYLSALFVGIRKSFFQKILQTVEQSGLVLKHIEPAAVSLMHLLRRNNILSRNKTTAVLEINDDTSEIIVIQDEVLHFMRDLNISLAHLDFSTLMGFLQNDVRVSFNFYNRRNRDQSIDNLIILSRQEIPGAVEILKKELNVPVSMISLDKLIPVEEFQTNIYASAYGATLGRSGFSPKYFDLSREAAQMQRFGKGRMQTFKRHGLMFGIAGGCVIAAIVLISFLSSKTLQRNTVKIERLKQRLGVYASFSLTDLEIHKQRFLDELNFLVSVPLESRVSVILSEISEGLPAEMWLTGVQVSYDWSKMEDIENPKAKIMLSGKIYDPDPNRQFRVLNDFIADLKKNERLSAFYQEVKRESANRTVENGRTITTFSITCN